MWRVVMENQVWKDGGREHSAEENRVSCCCLLLRDAKREESGRTLVEEGSFEFASLSASIVVVAGGTDRGGRLRVVAKDLGERGHD